MVASFHYRVHVAMEDRRQFATDVLHLGVGQLGIDDAVFGLLLDERHVPHLVGAFDACSVIAQNPLSHEQ